MIQLMPLPSSISLTFLVPAYPSCPTKEAIKRVSVLIIITTRTIIMTIIIIVTVIIIIIF